jgi:hypothetical protein
MTKKAYIFPDGETAASGRDKPRSWNIVVLVAW